MSADHSERAERRIRGLWGRLPLAGWIKNAANKRLSRRLFRARLRRETQAMRDESYE
ncbi:MAG: hypothetical protein ACK5PF_02075 [bacterium]|jgi:hypothetical protein